MASKIPRQNHQDGFSDHLQYIARHGLMAGMTGGMFKNFMVSQVQEYSRRIALDGEPHSALFMTLCDLMLDGHFAKMPESALKVYLIMNIYRYQPLEKSALEIIRELSGLPAREVGEAIEYLDENNWLFSSDRKRLSGSSIVSFRSRDSGVRKSGKLTSSN